MPYNPLTRPELNVTLLAEEHQIDGLGIFLVMKNLDSVEYAYRDRHNILTVSKRL